MDYCSIIRGAPIYFENFTLKYKKRVCSCKHQLDILCLCTKIHSNPPNIWQTLRKHQCCTHDWWYAAQIQIHSHPLWPWTSYLSSVYFKVKVIKYAVTIRNYLLVDNNCPVIVLVLFSPFIFLLWKGITDYLYHFLT